MRSRYITGMLLSAILPLSGYAASTSTSSQLTTVHAPCSDSAQANATATTTGLRKCSAYIPQLLAQISKPVASYPLPLPAASASPTAGMIQYYASAYYQGIDLDVSPTASTLPGKTYPGNNFGPVCELVPSNLNHNKTETGSQDPTNNPSSPSCGTPMQISVSVANCTAATDDEAALMNSLNITPAQLDGLTADQAQALLVKAAAAKPNVVSAAASGGKKICISLDASGKDLQGSLVGQNGSLERTYMRGTFLQALSYYTDQTLAQLQCQHAVTVAGPSCQKFASNLTTLTGSTQSNMNHLQSLLQSSANIADTDFCSSQTFNATSSGTLDAGTLRQSAQLLCSARSSLEAAFSNLVMCNIFSQAQTSYIANTGAPALQVNMLNEMNASLDPICRPLCKNKQPLNGSGDSVQSCLQSCYNKQMPIYLTSKFQTFWPQPTPAFSGACVGGS